MPKRLVKRSIRLYRRARSVVAGCCFIFAVIVALNHYMVYLLGLTPRVCTPGWKAIGSTSELRIALITLSDVRKPQGSSSPGRDFGGVLQATWANKDSYASRHNYSYIDASLLLDANRPPSWSKILAVRHYLKDYDWILWIDADTLITNPSIRIESLLPRDRELDLIITKDQTGYNAGMWLLRNSAWSLKFLDRWWAMDSFIRRRPGDTKSGDNDALKHLLGKMSRGESRAHVGVVPQCCFNSYLWVGSVRNRWRYLWNPRSFQLGLYQQGDFILHLAGIRNKQAHLDKALAELQGGEATRQLHDEIR